MTWRTYLGDTTSGVIDRPIDIPAFSWTMTVSDSSLSTTKGKNVGEMDYTGVTVPWTAISETDPVKRSSVLSALRRSLTLFWVDEDADPDDIGVPIMWGAIGNRTDTWLDTSFDLLSVTELLKHRVLANENGFGTGANGTSPGSVKFDNLSFRGIASGITRMCTELKPGGTLPLDLPYLNEKGSNSREYKDYDVQNNMCAELLDDLTNVLGGPDLQFRPYLSDSQHVRLRLLGGSDADVYLGQSATHSLTCFPGGGTLQDVQVDHASPIMRVYATGSGTDAAQLCHLSENRFLVDRSDPWPLMEDTYSDTDTDKLDELTQHADGVLESNRLPLMQISGRIDFSDSRVPKPGDLWPGERVDIALDGFPSLPDGVYECRLMQLSGDESTVASVKFDVMDDPVY